MKQNARFLLLAVFAATVCGGQGYGRNEWLTGCTKDGQSVPISFEALSLPLPSMGDEPANSAYEGIYVGTLGGLLDLTISIPDDPAGDNNGNAQGQPGSAEQDKWERMVQHFADAIYDMTEGAHKVRKVRIFKKGKFANNADIVWTEKGHPHVGKGVGEPGGNVKMYKIFANGSGTTDKDMVTDEVGSGYTMAHEYGHYFYGLYDEYAKSGSTTDISVAPSVMANQWNARNDARWLNFSIKNNGGGEYQDTLFNNQHLIHGASCWETLVRDPAKDPRVGSLGRRIRFSELSAVAPTGTNVPVVNLPSAAARSALNIIWADKVLYELVIDNSGSMLGSAMENAKAAAKLLVDRAEVGASKVGVVKFSSTASVVTSVTAITSDADKAAIKSQIDQITATGATAIGDAAMLGLSQVSGGASAGDTGVVFLLSDGVSNTGSDPLAAIPSYQAAQVPLFTFAFGAGADGSALRAMAEGTGGKFYSSPTSLGDITLAFQDAFSAVASEPVLTHGILTVGTKTTAKKTIAVDMGVSKLNVNLVVPIGPATVMLEGPGGQIFSPAVVTASTDDVVYSYTVPSPLIGNWTISAKGNGAATNLRYQVDGSGSPAGLALSAYSLEGTDIMFPAPVLVRASLSGARSVIGATVTATATAPLGTEIPFQLKDNGTAPDNVAGDGTYSAYFYYTSNGVYQFKVSMDNRNRTAKYSSKKSVNSPNTLGFAGSVEADSPIGYNFVRTAQFAAATRGGFFTSSASQLPRGTYTTLILGPDGDHAHSGMVQLTLGAAGAYSGRLHYAGKSYPLSGKMNAFGALARNIVRPGLQTLQLAIQIDALNGSDSMSGTLLDGGLTIPFSASRTFYDSRLSPAPEAGNYSCAILPEESTDPSQVPPGIGYARVIVSKSGSATFSGRLADGSLVSGSSHLTIQGEIPFYISLYDQKGSMHGTYTFQSVSGICDLAADLQWFKPVRSRDTFYPLGFETHPVAVGSLYSVPPPGATVVNLTFGSLDLSGGDLLSPLPLPFQLTTANTFAFDPPNANGGRLTVNKSTGILSGDFRHPLTGKTVQLYGAVVQEQDAGGGYFLAGTQGGRFEIGALESAPTAVIYNATDVPLAIPDSNSSGIASSLTSSSSGNLLGCSISLDITHTWRGDLIVTLISPDGTNFVLLNQEGGNADNVLFTNFEVPNAVGLAGGGVWTLMVADVVGGDVGTLNSWSLKLISR